MLLVCLQMIILYVSDKHLVELDSKISEKNNLSYFDIARNEEEKQVLSDLFSLNKQ